MGWRRLSLVLSVTCGITWDVHHTLHMLSLCHGSQTDKGATPVQSASVQNRRHHRPLQLNSQRLRQHPPRSQLRKTLLVHPPQLKRSLGSTWILPIESRCCPHTPPNTPALHVVLRNQLHLYKAVVGL